MHWNLGVCAGLKDIAMLDELGFDHIEVFANSIAELSEEDFAKELAAYRLYNIPVKTCCIFFAGSMRLLTRDRDIAAIEAHIERTLARMEMLGVELVVFGSGASRRFDDDMTYKEAFGRMIELCRLFADLAAPHGIKVVIEPLNRLETNMINSLGEGAALAAAVDRPNFGLMGDLYHIMKDHEALEDLKRVAPIDHVHIATIDRQMALTESELEPLVQILDEIDYKGRISVEVFVPIEREDAAAVLRNFRAVTAG